MKKNYILSLITFLVGFLGFSQSYLDGILVLNEGNYGSNAASVSFMTTNNQVTGDIFGLANNNDPLGDVAQSMNFIDDKAYIVLNGSSAIKVVNYETFEVLATIDQGLTNPRYIAFHNNKGYVTCWGDGSVTTDDYLAVINLTTNLVESTIPMAEGVETIEVINDKLYVAHQGGYGYGTTISVVEISNQNVSSIIVGDLPSSMIVKDNFLYVLCRGLPSWSGQTETTGKLVKIDLTDNSIVSDLSFDNITHPSHLIADADNLYYTIGSDIFKMPFTNTTLPTTSFITTPVTDYLGIYGLDLIDDKIYVADANGYAATGFAHIYNVTGDFVITNTVENIPNNFYKSKESSLGLDDNLANTSFSLYPNPATTTFYINSNKNVAVKIFDLTGKVVKTQLYNTSGIDVSNLEKGIYIVEINSENKKQISKLIVK